MIYVKVVARTDDFEDGKSENLHLIHRRISMDDIDY